MATPRRVLPVALSTGALLIAATTCLAISYAGIETAPTRESGLAHAGEDSPLRADATLKTPMYGLSIFDEQVAEQEVVAEMPEKAEEAREESEEEREEQGSSTRFGPSNAAVLRAHMEVVNARDMASGGVPDPCLYIVALPPGDGRTQPKVKLSLTRKLLSGGAGESRTLTEMTTEAGCMSSEGFFRDMSKAPARVTLCPASCAWARSAVHGLTVDVLLSGF